MMMAVGPAVAEKPADGRWTGYFLLDANIHSEGLCGRDFEQRKPLKVQVSGDSFLGRTRHLDSDWVRVSHGSDVCGLVR